MPHRAIGAARASILLNVALFQLGWWACILLAAPVRAVRLALACLAVGAMVESVLVAAHVTAYRTTGITWSLAPPWMIGLWALLSTTLSVSLRWLLGHPLLGIAFGAAAGALAYGAGARLGALILPSAWSLWVIAAVWGAALPGLLRLAARWDENR